MSKNHLIQLGILGRPFGVKGEITLHSFNTQSSTLKPNMTVTLHLRNGENLKSSSFLLENFRWNKDIGLIKFQGLDSVDLVKQWVHSELYVPRSDLPALGPSEYYLCDLLGFEVFVEEKSLGHVEGFSFNTASQTIIHVKTHQGEVLDVLSYPFMKKVDLKESRCYILLPDYEE